MVFDLISFLSGIFAGGLTGVLAGILYSFERTADLQESVLKIRKKFEAMYSRGLVSNKPNDASSEKEMQELRTELDSIQEEIRKMYRKAAR